MSLGTVANQSIDPRIKQAKLYLFFVVCAEVEQSSERISPGGHEQTQAAARELRQRLGGRRPVIFDSSVPAHSEMAWELGNTFDVSPSRPHEHHPLDNIPDRATLRSLEHDFLRRSSTAAKPNCFVVVSDQHVIGAIQRHVVPEDTINPPPGTVLPIRIDYTLGTGHYSTDIVASRMRYH